MSSLQSAFKKAIEFLNKHDIDYLVIGGIAVGALGNPRLTNDMDFSIFIKKKDVKGFLDKAGGEGFTFDQKEIKERLRRGTFKIFYGDIRVDFIIASLDFERSALKRKQKIAIYDTEAFFPTPEDMILYKIVPARPQDLVDIENIVNRHYDKLDWGYLETCAQKLSDLAEDTRFYREIKKLRKGKLAEKTFFSKYLDKRRRNI